MMVEEDVIKTSRKMPRAQGNYCLVEERTYLPRHKPGRPEALHMMGCRKTLTGTAVGVHRKESGLGREESEDLSFANVFKES